VRYLRAKRDATHAPIVAGLLAHGRSVLELHAVGGGAPDALVGNHGWDYLLEFKIPGHEKTRRSPTHMRTREKQQKFRDSWRGHPVAVVTSLEEALFVTE
jgi:hypothetical protein